MSSAARRVHHSYAEYVALEEESPTRHEYLDGEIYAMAGGTPDHAALAAAVIQRLGSALPPGCRIFTSDLRIRIAATGLSTYPDAAIVCGKTLRASDDPLAVVNPVVVVEITSPSTEDYDRGEKLRHYQSLPSLREALIVSHREPRVTVVRRTDGGEWIASEARAGESLVLTSTGGTIAVSDLYRDGLEDSGT
jgi:Uma2 family endonuclease